MAGLHVGVADHLGWAVVVTVSADRRVVDRRRVGLVGPGLPAAPVHHVGGPHAMHAGPAPVTDDELAALVDGVRRSVADHAAQGLADLARSVRGDIGSLSLRGWPADFPTDVATVRRPPYESRADPVMYRTLLSDAAASRGWDVHTYDPRDVEYRASRLLVGGEADLAAPRRVLGAPWNADHRRAFAAAVIATEGIARRS